MKKSLLGLAVAATLGLSFAASADDMYRGAWYAVPGVSYMNTDSDLEADNDLGGFIAIGKELSPSWDLQGRLGYTSANEDTGIAGAGGNYKQTSLGLDALYMFSRDKFRPFLLAGIGAAHNNVDYSGIGLTDKSKTSWMANVGLGAQYLFNDTFGIQADLRHQWSKAEAQNAARTVDADETIGNTLLSLGGIFRFGAPAPVVAEAAPEPAPLPVAEPEPAPAPAPEPAPEVKCVPQVETISIGAEKLFAFNKAGLQDTSVIDNEVVAKMKDNPIFASVKIVGHTDKLGSEAYNQKLSEKRANMVRDYIISKGIDASRLVAVGMGETSPKVNCDGTKGRKAMIECLAPNRRVEIEATRSVESGCN
ncbi:MAG: outer membrane beta-barrel protein [Methylophilus sp.]